MARFKIGDRIYTAAAIDRLSIRNLLELERETGELLGEDRRMKWGDLRALADRVSDLPEDEIEGDPEFPWFLGMLIWAARLEAGEKITFTEAIDFPLGDLEMIADPGDHKAPTDPHRARPASGRAGADPRAPRAGKRPKGSAKRSSDA